MKKMDVSAPEILAMTVKIDFEDGQQIMNDIIDIKRADGCIGFTNLSGKLTRYHCRIIKGITVMPN